MEERTSNEAAGGDPLAVEIKERVSALIDDLVQADHNEARKSFEFMLEKAVELWHRKQAMEGTKSGTRDLLGEILFTRLRRAFRNFLASDDSATEIRAAEWVLGTLFAGGALTEFATALDRAMLESARPQDFSFAGRADFISVEEVLQMLSTGKYTGMLGMEKADNRVDLYIRKGKVDFLDPHHLIRRVLPGHGSMQYREVSREMLKRAEAAKAKDGTPLLLSLAEFGFVKESELADLLHNLGLEVFYEFLSERGACMFFYKQLDQMPAFVEKWGHSMPVTPILLEGSKRNDDWLAMLKVFPDIKKPIQPVDDMFARIAELDLGVLEIKLLAMINGETSPKQLAPAIGLPKFEVYQYLVRYAQEEILVPDGGPESVREASFTLEDTMEKAFAALDENDDEFVRRKPREKAPPEPRSAGKQARPASAPPAHEEHESFLDILAKADFKE